MKQSFDDFIKNHTDRIYRICYSYLYDKTVTDDVYQEVLFQIWKSMKQFKGEAKVETWIYRIAVNRTITYNHKKKLNTSSLDVDQFDKTDQPKSENEQIDLLHQAIGKLNSDERLLINLMLDSFTYQQIADLIGIRVNHVGVKLNRIRKKLEKLIEDIK